MYGDQSLGRGIDINHTYLLQCFKTLLLGPIGGDQNQCIFYLLYMGIGPYPFILCSNGGWLQILWILLDTCFLGYFSEICGLVSKVSKNPALDTFGYFWIPYFWILCPNLCLSIQSIQSICNNPQYHVVIMLRL